ncbi:hypothetical protein LLG07_03360 [bacterium]|nr:hypothetical protein [bacterium]
MVVKNCSSKTYFTKNRLITVWLIIFLFGSMSLLAGCSTKVDIKTLIKSRLSGDNEMNAAVTVVDNFFKFLIAGNTDKAYSLISSKDKKSHNPDDFKKELKNVTEIVEIEINWVEVKNNIANVGIDLTDNYDDEEKVYKDLIVSLVKEEDGNWKINFWD